jgi:hypothetical protein
VPEIANFFENRRSLYNHAVAFAIVGVKASSEALVPLVKFVSPRMGSVKRFHTMCHTAAFLLKALDNSPSFTVKSTLPLSPEKKQPLGSVWRVDSNYGL